MYGDNIALINIIPSLIKKRVTPFFLVQREGDFSRFLKANGYNFKVIPFTYNIVYSLNKNKHLRWMLYLLKLTLYSRNNRRYINEGTKIINTFKPDIIHTNCSATAFGYLLAQKNQISHIWHLREYMTLDHNKEYFPSKNFFLKKLDSANNECICITPDIKEYFSSKKNKVVIYDGVVEDNLPIIDISNKKNQILFVGRLLETKGIYDVVNAFCKVCKQSDNFTLCIIGDGASTVKENIKKIIEIYDADKIVSFLGYRKDIYSLMRESKAIVVASRFEAFGFITAEAMYNKCLVIGRNTAGTKLQLDNCAQYYGFEVGIRYEKQEELERAIDDLIHSDYSIYDKMLSAAQKAVVNFYSKQSSAISVNNLYNRIKK